MRFLLGDRLLLGLGNGGLLPLPALHYVIAVLATLAEHVGSDGGSDSSGSDDGSAGGAATGEASSALAAAALAAAQLWGDVGALRQLPPQRQVCVGRICRSLIKS